MRFLLLLLGVLCAVLAPPCFALPVMPAYSPSLKVSPKIWQFRTKAQMQQVLAANISNPRAVYHIFNEAYRYKLEGAVTWELEKYQGRNTQDPALGIMLAYAYEEAAGYGGRIFQKGTPAETNELASGRSSALAFVDAELMAKVKDPALLVMAAVATRYTIGKTNRPLVLGWLRRALQAAPTWADAHYWYGNRLRNHGYNLYWEARMKKRNANVDHLFRSAESHLKKAMKLNPGMTGDCYMMLAFNSESLQQYQQAMDYFRLYQKYRRYPSDKEWDDKFFSRNTAWLKKKQAAQA